MFLTGYFYLASISIFAIIGIIKFCHSLPVHFKGIIFMMPYILLTEICAAFFRNLIKYENIMLQYSIVMLIEFLIYAYFFKQIILSKLVKKMILIFMIVFPVFWCISVLFIFRSKDWNSYVFLTGGTFTIVWALIYCYQLLISVEDNSIGGNGEFWIALGIIIFYSCEVPFMGLFNFLKVNYPSLIMDFQAGLQIINIIMYSLFTYALLCKKTNTTKYL